MSEIAQPTSLSPAFKEWQVIVSALEAGRQTILLRKGGIAEGRGGFQVSASRFWLFPTHFHAQREKTLPEAGAWYHEPTPNGQLVLTSYAEVVEHVFLDSWETVRALAPFHVWTEETVKERFEWAKPSGITLLIIRNHKLKTPFSLPFTKAMSGCKSWVELPLPLEGLASMPVLDDQAFTKVYQDLKLAIKSRCAKSLEADPP